jgi:predicted RNase H-like HicB family nuclease
LNDFGDRRFAPEGDGGEVAEFIRLHLSREKYPRHVLVHSVNDTGSRMIAEKLESTKIHVTVRAFSNELLTDLEALVTHLRTVPQKKESKMEVQCLADGRKIPVASDEIEVKFNDTWTKCIVTGPPGTFGSGQMRVGIEGKDEQLWDISVEWKGWRWPISLEAALAFHYPISIYWLPEITVPTGYYLAFHPDFGQSACSATGDTALEALNNLDEVRKTIICHYAEKGSGHVIPEPSKFDTTS